MFDERGHYPGGLEHTLAPLTKRGINNYVVCHQSYLTHILNKPHTIRK